jgi:hypothetical protein
MGPIWVQLGAIGVPNDGPLGAHVVNYNSFPRRVFSSTPDDIPHQIQLFATDIRLRAEIQRFATDFMNCQISRPCAALLNLATNPPRHGKLSHSMKPIMGTIMGRF